MMGQIAAEQISMGKMCGLLEQRRLLNWMHPYGVTCCLQRISLACPIYKAIRIDWVKVIAQSSFGRHQLMIHHQEEIGHL